MDRRDIARAALQMKSKSDLLGLLNAVKREELRERGIDVETFYPFTMTHIQCYCNPNNVFRRYKQFCIKKKSGKLRQITAPRNKSYMMLLQSLNIILKAIYTPSKYAMGFTEGRSVVSNASVHKGQNYVFNIDLKDFFPSITATREITTKTKADIMFLVSVKAKCHVRWLKRCTEKKYFMKMQQTK